LVTNGFPAPGFRQEGADVAPLFPVNDASASRLLFNDEGDGCHDWKADGVTVNATPSTHRHTCLDAGPRVYHVTVVAALFQIPW